MQTHRKAKQFITSCYWIASLPLPKSTNFCISYCSALGWVCQNWNMINFHLPPHTVKPLNESPLSQETVILSQEIGNLHAPHAIQNPDAALNSSCVSKPARNPMKTFVNLVMKLLNEPNCTTKWLSHKTAQRQNVIVRATSWNIESFQATLSKWIRFMTLMFPRK